MKIKRCVQCGQLFEAYSNRAQYCSDRCRARYHRPRGSVNEDILQVARLASAAGMSYGKYVARQRAESVGRLRREE